MILRNLKERSSILALWIWKKLLIGFRELSETPMGMLTVPVIWLYNLKFGELWSSNTRVYDGHRHPLINQQFYYIHLTRHCRISTEFCEAISAQFCFTYSLRGICAMLHRLHTRLCHAFLVFLSKILYMFSSIVTVSQCSY